MRYLLLSLALSVLPLAPAQSAFLDADQPAHGSTKKSTKKNRRHRRSLTDQRTAKAATAPAFHATFIDTDLSSPAITNKANTKKRRHHNQLANRRHLFNRPASHSALSCMAQNIYFEAGIESEAGKIAVANVTMNRVKSSHYPNSVCGVVHQRGHGSCAFSWTCDARSNVVPNNENYRESLKVARWALSGALRDITGNADHYHADYVRPKWARKGEQKARIGRHLFYKLIDS